MMTREDRLQLCAWAVVGVLMLTSAIVIPAGLPSLRPWTLAVTR